MKQVSPAHMKDPRGTRRKAADVRLPAVRLMAEAHRPRPDNSAPEELSRECAFEGILATLKERNREAGLALVEVLVALGLVTTVVLAIGATAASVLQGHGLSANHTIAINLAQAKMEEVKARGPLSGESVTDYPTGSSGITYTRTVEIRAASFSKNLKQVDVMLSWTERGFSRSVVLNTYVFAPG